MARTRDFLDDMADWYALPDSRTTTGPRALGLPPLSAAALGPERFRSAWRRAFATLLAWTERARQRRALLRMSDRMLHDIGVSRSAALAEAAKPFWRA